MHYEIKRHSWESNHWVPLPPPDPDIDGCEDWLDQTTQLQAQGVHFRTIHYPVTERISWVVVEKSVELVN
jgi:hypothetical protein